MNWLTPDNEFFMKYNGLSYFFHFTYNQFKVHLSKTKSESYEIILKLRQK